jgi:hypothetical protein
MAAYGRIPGALDGSKQLDLKVQPQLTDFVQEQGAVIRQIQVPVFVELRPGEGAFFMAEKFAFQEIFRDRAAVYRYKGRVPPVADFVDGLGREVFAGAGFAVY